MDVINEEADTFAERVVWYPRFKKTYETLCHFLKFGGNDAEAMIIFGPVGAGKSFMLEQLERDFPVTDTPNGTIRPVLSIRVAPENTLTGMLGNLLSAMGDPMPAGCSIVVRRLRLKKLIVAQCTRIVLIDESQSIMPRRGGDDKSEKIKLLRELTDDLKIPIVLTGKEDVKSILTADDALRSRVRCAMSLEYFSCKSADEALDFADYMDALLGMFPRKLHGFTFIEETENGGIVLSQNINNLVRVMLATDGCPRSIKFLLKSVLTTTSPDTVVTTEHFGSIFYMANNIDKSLLFNPFKAPFGKVKAEAEKRGLYDSDAF